MAIAQQFNLPIHFIGVGEKIEDLECVKKYYGYSTEKATQALNILTKEQLKFIKQKFETGGMK